MYNILKVYCTQFTLNVFYDKLENVKGTLTQDGRDEWGSKRQGHTRQGRAKEGNTGTDGREGNKKQK